LVEAAEEGEGLLFLRGQFFSKLKEEREC
jgi:hypothetical protein